MLARILILLCILVNVCWAEAEKKPIEVKIGVYPTALHQLNFADDNYKVGFYLWAITSDPDYDPFKSLEIINSFDYEFKNKTKSQREDGKYLYAMHVFSTNFHYWNVKNFPFDTQKLKIKIEDADDVKDVRFVPDTAQSTLPKNLILEGWKPMGLDVHVLKHQYDSTLGAYTGKDDIVTQHGDVYSQFVATISIKRYGGRLFFNFYIGFFVAFILTSFIFFIEPSQIGTRSGYTLSSIFSAVGNKYIVDRYLPVINQFSLNDVIQLATFGLILCGAFITITTYHIDKSNPALAAKVSDRVGMICIPGFVLFVSYFLIVSIWW